MTLADKETNLILTDKVNRVIQGNVAMQVTQPGGQPWNYVRQCRGGEGCTIQIRNSFFAENFVRKGGWGYPPYGQNPQSSI